MIFTQIPGLNAYSLVIDVMVGSTVQMVKMKRVVVLKINSLVLQMLRQMVPILWSKSAYLLLNGVMGTMIVQIRVTRNLVYQVFKH